MDREELTSDITDARIAVDIQPMRSLHVEDVVQIHIDSFPHDFLPSLGADFLRTLYRGLMKAPSTVSLVALDKAKVIGFVVGALDTRQLFLQLLRRQGTALAWQVLRRMPKHPSILWRTFEAITYPRKEKGDLPKAELVVLAIANGARCQGLGKALVVRLNAELKPRGITAYKVSTAQDNTRADAFYHKLGFRLEHTFVMHHRTFNLYTCYFS